MKISFKARHGRKANPVPHKRHRKKIPSEHDRVARRLHHLAILEMRAREQFDSD